MSLGDFTVTLTITLPGNVTGRDLPLSSFAGLFTITTVIGKLSFSRLPKIAEQAIGARLVVGILALIFDNLRLDTLERSRWTNSVESCISKDGQRELQQLLLKQELANHFVTHGPISSHSFYHYYLPEAARR